MTATTDLDARYGRRPDDRARQRRLGILAAAGVVLIFAVWTLWRFIGSPATDIEATVRGFDAVSESEFEVTALVTFDREASVSCVIEVLGTHKQIVGWKEITLPAAAERTRVVTEPVATVERGVTGLISHCRLT